MAHDSAHPRPRRLGFLPLVTPAWLVLGGLFLLPLLGVLLVSFAKSDDYGDPVPLRGVADLWHHVSSGDAFANYAQTVRPGTLAILWRSLWIAAATTVLTALVSYPVAYYLAVRAPARAKGLLLALVVVPFWTSFLVRTYAWMIILRPEGLLNAALLRLGVVAAPLDLLYNDGAVLVGLVYGELPFMILPLYASLEKLDRSLLEAADDLGAGGWSAFRRVTFPLSVPGLVAGAVLVFVPSVGQFVVSDLLGGGKSVLVGNLVQSQFAAASGIGDRPYGAAVAFQLTAAVLLLVGAYGWWARRGRRGRDEEGK
ncbi:MAG: binding-protein-dependent transport system inner rane component [Phycisphaerales bacterium]|nr:binding-protein-dependent transport system inner rane component [Phycisphaerales bacterium]